MMKRTVYVCTVVIFAVLVSLLFFSCEKGEDQEIGAELPSVKVIDNIPYRDGDSEAWRLDMAIPENFGEKPFPAIVIIHGGGWRAGSKQVNVYRTLLLDYAFQGYVTLSVEYRLVDEAPFPACIEDVKCAVRWLRAHAEKYNVDPERIGAFGHSAGAHLALMVAMTPNVDELEGDEQWYEYSSHLNAVVGGSTPTQIIQRPNLDNSAWWPVSYIAAGHPPMLLIHGTEDKIVPIEPMDEFVAKLKEAGMEDLTYLRIDGGNHGVAYEFNLDVTKPAMDEFFARTLKHRSQ
ncbi:alpha/beta hydrolase [candidate division KSB1 bacterium]|nr:alpha/beta hydrolase [candidate division KSB1 bacterium]